MRLMVAERGALIAPANRIAQCVTERGDERLAPLLRWLGTTVMGKRLLGAKGRTAGQAMEQAIARHGVRPELITGEIGDADWPDTVEARIKRNDEMPKLTRYGTRTDPGIAEHGQLPSEVG